MGVNELSTALWRQRELLELLLFKYEEEHLLLASGRSKWIPFASRELEAVASRHKLAALEVSVIMVDVATELGISPEARLREVISACDDVWSSILTAHLSALSQLTTEIQSVRGPSDQLLRQALRSTQETLNALGGQATTYNGDGRADSGNTTIGLVDAQA